MDFLDGSPLVCARVAVRILSFFFDFFVAILTGFWVPAGTSKSTKNRFFHEKDVPGTSFFTIFAACAFFLIFFIDFPSILA